MSHRALIVSSIIAAGLGLAPAVTAQMNPRGETRVTLAGKPIVVDYGRPGLKGRDMLGKAAVGDEWRMGADSATTLKTPVTLTFGAKVVPPGDYVLRARKASETDWTLKFEQDGKAVAEVPLTSTALDRSVELFTIDLAEEKGEGVFRMSWGNRELAARFTAK